MAGRNTQGVRLIRLEGKDLVSDVSAVPSEEEEAVAAQAARTESARKSAAPAVAATKDGGEVQPDLPTGSTGKKRTGKAEADDEEQPAKGVKPVAEPARAQAKSAKAPAKAEKQTPGAPAKKPGEKRKGKKR